MAAGLPVVLARWSVVLDRCDRIGGSLMARRRLTKAQWERVSMWLAVVQVVALLGFVVSMLMHW